MKPATQTTFARPAYSKNLIVAELQAENLASERALFSLADLRDWRAATTGFRLPFRLAVLGDPVAHSASPQMQNAALAACELDLRYTRLHVAPGNLPEAVRLLAPADFLGANLTIPHKVAALPLLDSVDPHAAELGAVNTLRVEVDGRVHGFNTDGPGFVRAVETDLGMTLAGASVLILGAGGGAGRALATQCALARCARLFLVNRTPEKAQRLAEELRRRFNVDVQAALGEDAALRSVLATVDLIVNTSALGLRAEDPSPLLPGLIPPRVRVFDTVYRRGDVPTPLVAAAREAGVPAVGGLSLLLHQGALAFEIWFDRPAPLEIMRRALLSA